MNSPNNELKAMATEARPLKDNDKMVLEWLKLFLGLPIARMGPKSMVGDDGKPDLMSNSPLVKENFDGFSHSHIIGDDEILMQFFVNAHIGVLLVQVHHDGMAQIEDFMMPFGSGQDPVRPSFLKEAGILGFYGTWEQSFRKLIELNNLVAKQVPEVPEDLKKR